MTGDRDGASPHERTFTWQSVLDEPIQEVFAWHERPGSVERLIPPWEPLRVERSPQGHHVGSRTVLRSTVPGPAAMRLVTERTDHTPVREFCDEQLSGPFSSLRHRHVFEEVDGGHTRLTDEVTCELPLPQADSVTWPLVKARLGRIFDYRHRQLAGDLATHRRARERGAVTMHVAVTGASGLIGSALVALLRSGGHSVTRLVRRDPSRPDEVCWDPSTGWIDAEGLRGVDAVVHLAGAPLFGRWTRGRKRQIRESRAHGTRALAATLAGMEDGPRVLICASGVNFYGYDRGDERLTEQSEPGGGFLADVVRDWEAAADPAREAGLRVVHLRTGLVLSPRGGVLQLQLPLFALGAGGRLGPGTQWMSWIGIDDIVGVYHHALTTPGLHGAVNATAPHPVTNVEFTRALGNVLRRPTPLPVPKFGPSLLLGEEGAAETAFASQRVLPASGYVFRQPSLQGALRHVLGR